MVFLPSLHAGVNEKKETLVGRTTKENGARTHKKAKKKEVSYTAEVGRAATDDTHAHTHTLVVLLLCWPLQRRKTAKRAIPVFVGGCFFAAGLYVLRRV